MENLYEYVFDAEKMEGVFCASLVENPAIEIEMVHCSKEEETQIFQLASEEKRLIISPLMIPNKKIWRNNLNGFTYATEHTIEQLQQNFAKQRYGNGSTIEHSTPIEGVYVSESWLIQDTANDKSNIYGFKDLPKGTWMIAMKIEDDSIWEEYVKTGKVKGVSIDAALGVKKVNSNITKVKMNKQTLNDIVEMAIQKVALASELKQFDIEGADPVFTTELVKEGMVMDKDNKPLADFEFVYEGKNYKTDAAGIIVEISDVEVKEEELAEEAPAEDTAKAELEAELAKKDELVKSLEAKLADAEAKIVKLEADVVLKEKEKVEMSKDVPASVGITNVPKESLDKEVTSGLLAAMRKHK